MQNGTLHEKQLKKLILLSKKSILQEKLIFIKRREQEQGKTNSVWTFWII